MNSTETTPAPAVGGRQVGQLLAGRYRLGLFKGGDDIADVWHALDESTEKVVTLEILRDLHNDAARQRFLAEAHRMAAIERPSVMRVAAIHNEATVTFIVFEHLIPLPVVLTGLTAVAKDVKPATKAAEEKTVVLSPVPPQAPAGVVPSPLASIAGPKRSAGMPDVSESEATAPSIVDLDLPTPSTSPVGLHDVSTSLEAARSDASGLAQSIAADLRGVVRDAGLEELVAAVRARIPRRLDGSALSAFAASAATLSARIRGLIARASPTANVASKPRSTSETRSPSRAPSQAKSGSSLAVDALKALTAGVATALPLISSAALRLGAAARPLIARARRNQLVSGVAIGGLLLVVFVASPLDDAIVSALRSTPLSLPTTPAGGLTRAPFELPPLSAYGAAFESQGAYPKTTPNGNVEWVVALRNTGSVGWYRGMEGAQAALALPDGTGVAVQSTPYVAPGQIGWFVVHFRARAEVGTYTVQLLPRIDGRGPLPDLGIYTVVTVTKNP